MITRTAIFEGRIKSGFEQRFKQEVHEHLAPIWRCFPPCSQRAAADRAGRRWPKPPIVMMQQIDHPSQAALAEPLASPVRAEARAMTLELMQMFDGRLYHVVSEAYSVQPSRL